MKKTMQLLILVIGLLVLSVGCKAPIEEGINDPVTLEPEETKVVEEASVVEEVDEDLNDENLFPSFELKNLEDEVVTEAIFANHELTLVNIWGTTCAPCIKEMPELQQLQTDYEDQGFNVIGFVVDANYLAAKEIANALLVTYDQIIPDEDFRKDYLRDFQFIPTTLFVDKNGVIVGEPMVGAYDYETFEEKIKEYMELE